MKKFHLIKPLEAVIIGLVLLGSIAVIFVMNNSRGSKTAVITCGEVKRELSLEKDGVFGLEGAEFEVKDGKIRIINAACPDKLCEKTGFIGAPGQSIICVPNKITVTVGGDSDNKNDGASVDATIG